MLQPGSERDLFEEAVGAQRPGDLGTQHLEGDLAGMLEVPGEIDGRHPAPTELALDRVALRDGDL